MGPVPRVPARSHRSHDGWRCAREDPTAARSNSQLEGDAKRNYLRKRYFTKTDFLDAVSSQLFLADKSIHSGEREHAAALYMACRHLPAQLLATPGERAGMLSEAAKTLEKIGDRKSLEECYRLMKGIGNTVQA